MEGLSRATSSASDAPTPPRRYPGVITVSGARRLNRSGELKGYPEHLYDMSPVVAASERNARLNALVERYMENSLGSLDSEDLLGNELTRRDSNAKKEESEASHLVSDEIQEGESNGWKKHSRKLSGIFKKG
jgi:hypothetical protein